MAKLCIHQDDHYLANVIQNFVAYKIDVQIIAHTGDDYMSPYIETSRGNIIYNFSDIMDYIANLHPEAKLNGKDDY